MFSYPKGEKNKAKEKEREKAKEKEQEKKKKEKEKEKEKGKRSSSKDTKLELCIYLRGAKGRHCECSLISLSDNLFS